MKTAEKIIEHLLQTVIRTVVTTTIIAFFIFLLHVFRAGEKSKLTLFEMIWSMVFCIVFVGHWLELLFINQLKFPLPKNILVWYSARIGYWFLCAIPLFMMMNLVVSLFSYSAGHLGYWWIFSLLYIGIQLFMHAIMQVRLKKSFYNGVY